MIIKSISVSYFKSLAQFSIRLAKFSCLIGLNGVGKSTVLQFVDFLGQLVRGDIEGWLDERHWSPREIHSSLSAHKNIGFAVILGSEEEERQGSWTASFNATQLHCTEETIETQGVVLKVQGDRLRIEDLSRSAINQSGPITFSYEGSVLSQLREEILPPPLVEFKNFFSGLKSFDLLSPENMRQRTREAGDSIGRGGKRLSAFLHELGPSGREQLTSRLKKAYPKLESLRNRPGITSRFHAGSGTAR
jgi:hypothetical protein